MISLNATVKEYTVNILIVDDDPMVLDLISLVLYQDGDNSISVAASGEAALDALRYSEERFEILVLDIEMPDMNGVELCANIRKIQEY